jgi:hypothetical protein
VTTRASSDLVKPGTTSDVYSVNEKAQARTSVLGGGGSSDQGYSAIAALPGAFVPPGNAGWFQSVYIRGGDYDQVGYEFDGVPVNRSFDNYPTTNLSALGQQELQLYTGASPASAESSGLAGYINQVIKTGTYPGFGAINLGIGGPNLYNKANIEFGGATPNRNFSYYIAAGLVDYAPLYIDNSQGASYAQQAGTPFDETQDPNGGGPGIAGCGAATSDSYNGCYGNTAYFGAFPVGPGGYQMGPFTIGGAAHLTDRESIFNFHFGIPHKNDAGKDDIQFLYNTFLLYTYYYGSINDWGGQSFYNTDYANNCVDCPGTWFTSGHQYTQGVGGLFTSMDPTQSANVVNYAFPSEGTAGLGGPIPLSHQDTADNGQGIYKLQWQRNIGTSSYFRLYGYIFYSWWFLHGANTTEAAFAGCCPGDYELWTHTRGLSAQYVNQLSNKHLLNVEGSYSTASTVRDNNSQATQCFGPNVTGCGGSGQRFAFLVSAANPTNGICYNSTNPGVNYSCEPTLGSGVRASVLTLSGVQGTGITAPSGTACNGPCAWYIAENGQAGTFNTVTPRFWAVSAQDTWKPNDKLNLNFGLRDDVYTFLYTPTGGGTRPFWFNAWNAANCVNPLFNGGTPFDMTSPPSGSGLAAQPAGSPCSNYGAGFATATFTNATANGGSITYNEIEPRLGGTYTFGPDDVLRFSAGRYSQAANAAFQQYNQLAQNLPNATVGAKLFYKFGFTTPNHVIRPSISNNYDMTFEHRFANSQTSFSLTPFLRQTTDQVQQIFIDPKTAFVSGLNAGRETNTGLEFLLNLGNFNANGWAGQVSYTYTKSTIKYQTLPSGGTVLDSDNQDIQNYNAFTSACAGVVGSSNPASQCGILGGVGVANTKAYPCFNTAGMGLNVCTAADNANPYYNQPAQALFNPNASYAPYDIVPAGVQLSAQGYVTPNNATAVVQWKHDKWAFIPAFQFHSGQVYGSPETMYGFNPASCGTPLASPVAGDPRYPAGGSGGAVDATTCGGSMVIPNTYTGKFDNIGAFTQPSQFAGFMTIAYDATPRVSYNVGLTNIFNTCFGGSVEPWTNGDHHICAYGVRPGNTAPVGNFYNPDSTIQQFAKYPYMQFSSTNGLVGYTTPFGVSFGVNVKL